MNAPEILATLRRRGATVRVLGGNQIEVAPRRVLDDGLRAVIRSHKPALLVELHRTEAVELTGGQILETRHELGAVLIRSRRFDCELWVALDPGMADELRAEEQARETPRPVLLPDDVASLRGKSEAMVKATLNTMAVFPGARIQ